MPSSVRDDLLNVATVAPPPGDADAGCTPDCGSSVTVHPDVTVAMAVGKTAAPAAYVPGERLTYTVNVSNAGPSDGRPAPGRSCRA